MKYYRVEISNGEITDCNEVTKKDDLHDYLLIKQYKNFVHIDQNSLNPLAYLCRAHGLLEAREKAQNYLERLTSNINTN